MLFLKAYKAALQPFLKAYDLEFAELIGEAQAPMFTRVLDALLRDRDYKDKVNAVFEGCAGDTTGSATAAIRS